MHCLQNKLHQFRRVYNVAATKLVIVESPAKARTIAKFLGKGYKVEASQGHVRDLPKSQLGVDVENDYEVKYITIHGRGKILTKIRKEAKNASRIYLATDPDREGEAISWHLAQTLGMDMEAPCRIEFHEITKKAIANALQSPRKLDMGLVDAQQARRALDRLVGYKISPLLWAKIKKGLSAGRVQSVATRMVVDREEEIEAFIPEEYWDITAHAILPNARGRKTTFKARLVTLDGEKAVLNNAEDAEKALQRVENAHFAVYSVKHGEKRKQPAPPFTTSSLQQEAGRKLNFTTQKTMQVVQQLYEGVDLEKEGTQGIVTYIRTDSVSVSAEALSAVREYIGEEYGEAYLPESANVFKGRSNAQNAHEAIRPTDVRRTPESIKASLTKEQFQLYRLIYSRFIASQMTNALYDTMTMEIGGDGVGLRFYGEHRKFAGFTAVYEEGSDDAAENSETTLTQLNEGDPVTIQEVNSDQHFTQPPARFTEASLVRMLEEKGIGRPSTYAPTITTIIARGYVMRENKRLFPTELGRMVTNVMTQYFAPIVDTEFTAQMEEQLDTIEEGNVEWKQVLRDFYPSFSEMLEEAEKAVEKIELREEPSDEVCDKCGAQMVYRVGRFGKFLACPNFPDCRNTKPVLNYIDTSCPKCGGRLLEKTSRKNRKFFGCEHYPECDFVSWEMPVDERCPKCGTYMTLKRNRKGEEWHLCANETCRYRTEAKTEETQEE
ncbi:MAG: type I DNA topoisomerase [Clostridia bacterium]|nr:type I DNA topoisomerase [Clostridia bacterium]